MLFYANNFLLFDEIFYLVGNLKWIWWIYNSIQIFLWQILNDKGRKSSQSFLIIWCCSCNFNDFTNFWLQKESGKSWLNLCISINILYSILLYLKKKLAKIVARSRFNLDKISKILIKWCENRLDVNGFCISRGHIFVTYHRGCSELSTSMML